MYITLQPLARFWILIAENEATGEELPFPLSKILIVFQTKYILFDEKYLCLIPVKSIEPIFI